MGFVLISVQYRINKRRRIITNGAQTCASKCSIVQVRIQTRARSRSVTENLAATRTWSVEDCSNPTPAQALTPKGGPLNLKGDNGDRLTLVARLVQWLISQNILVWEDGLDVMWDPATGNWWDDSDHRRGPHRGPGGGAAGLNRGPVCPCSPTSVTNTKTHSLSICLLVDFN